MNERLLKKLMNETPRMEVQDAVKLAFQSAFGCGHLLPSKERCVTMIEAEMLQTDVSDAPVYTPIGNGLCRLNLANAQVQKLDPEWIWRMMQLTDNVVRARPDTQARFDQAVALMDALAQKGEAPFDHASFTSYLNGRSEEHTSELQSR